MKLGIIGAGNVGSALGRALTEKGFDVLFYDVSDSQLEKLKEYKTTKNFDDVLETNVSFVCVPTESLPNGDINLTIIDKVMKQFSNKYTGIIVQTSICVPGTAKDMKKIANCDYVVVPSFYAMSDMLEFARHPVRIFIGTEDGEPNKIITNIFSRFDGPIFYGTYEEVEFFKYAENCLSATIISYWNEMFIMAEKMKTMGMKVDTDKIARIVDLSPGWRSVYRFHGKAFSGNCLPKDNIAFNNWAEKKLNLSSFYADANQKINSYMKRRYGENGKHLIYRN